MALRNSPTVKSLAQNVQQGLRQGFGAIYEAAKIVARVQANISREDGEREYDDDQIAAFFDELGRLGIGKGSKSYLTRKKDGGIRVSGSSTTYAMFNKIGASDLFKDGEVRKACLISSYSALYALVQLYEDFIDTYASGSQAQKEEGARKKILKLLGERGADLSRRYIKVKRDEIARKAKPSSKGSRRDVPSSDGMLRDLLDEKKRYDFLLLTPSKEFLVQVLENPSDEIERMLPIPELRNAKSDWMISFEGANIEAGLRLTQLFGDAQPMTVACLIDKSARGRLIDITKQTVIISSCSLPDDLQLRGNDGPLSIAAAISEGADRKLHLFADDANEGWDTLIGDDASIVTS